jgi:hypothetical protein
MATSNILGLFMSPEQYQAQQMAQQQAGEQQRAINFAGLTPLQQANYGVFMGAQQLGRGITGLLGVQDPQLQRIRQRQEIMQSINPADPESLMGGIQRASQAGDQELALTLTDFMNRQGSEMALARQRQAQADRERVQSQSGGIQEAARIREITLQQANLDPESNEYKALEAEKIELQNVVKNKTTDKVQQLKNLYVELEAAQKRAANRAAPSTMVGLDGQAFATRPQVNVENDPEVRAIQSLIRVATGEKPAKEVAAPEAVRTAEAYADSVSDDRKSKEWKDAYQSQLKKNDGKDKVSELRDLREQRIRAVAAGDTVEIGIIDRLINAIAPEKGGVDKDIAKAERIGELTDELEALEAESGKDSRAYRRKAAILESLKGGDKTPAPIKEQVLAGEIIKLNKFIRDAKDPNAPDVIDARTQVELYRDAMKRDKPNLTVVGEVRSGPDKGKTVYVDENNDQQFIYSADSTGKQVRKLISDADVSRLTSQVSASATSNMAPGVKAFREKLGGLDAKDVESARANRDNAIAAINTLNELTRLEQQGVTSGAFAEGRIGAVNLLNTLGLVSSKDAGTLANSQTFSKVSGDLILATLGGKLGAGFSNEDRKFIAGLVPQLETSRKARQQLISFMIRKNQLIIDEAIRLEDYARENDGLKGFKPRIPIVNAPAPGSVRAMTDAELNDAIEKARKKGK